VTNLFRGIEALIFDNLKLHSWMHLGPSEVAGLIVESLEANIEVEPHYYVGQEMFDLVSDLIQHHSNSEGGFIERDAVAVRMLILLEATAMVTPSKDKQGIVLSSGGEFVERFGFAFRLSISKRSSKVSFQGKALKAHFPEAAA
jgi:hypothetical protein